MGDDHAKLSHPGGGQRQSLVVALVALALALPSLGFSFVWDDFALVVRNPLVTGPFSPSGAFSSTLSLSEDGPSPFFRPLQLLALAAEHALSGGNPSGYHAASALLHALASVLVFLTARLLAPGGWGALAGALLFAAHPVHVEAATFVSAQGDLLATVFALAAVLLAEKAASTRETGRLLAAAAGAGVLCLLSLFSKEAGLLLPALLATWPWLRGPAREGAPRRGRAAGALGVALSLALAAYLVARTGVPAAVAAPAQPWPHLGGALRRVATYLRLLVDPTALRVLWPVEDPGWTRASAAGALLAAASLALAWRRRARNPVLLPAWCWFVATLLPALRLVPFPGPDVAARYLYLPSVALSWVVAGAWDSLEASRRIRPSRLRAGGVAVLALLAALWLREASAWRSEVALFGRMVRESPAWDLPRYNLGNALAAAGRSDEAIAEYEAAVRLNPAHAAARYNLGASLVRAGRRAEALPHLEAYLALRPEARDRAFVEALIATIRR